LLSHLAGERLRLMSAHPTIHGFAAHDEELRLYNVMLWNFSTNTVPIKLGFEGVPKNMRMRHFVLDAQTANNDENARLRPEPIEELKKGGQTVRIEFEPYGVQFWSFE